MADQKIWASSPINLSIKHSIAMESIATSIKKYKADAINEEETYLYNKPNNPRRVKMTNVMGSVSSKNQRSCSVINVIANSYIITLAPLIARLMETGIFGRNILGQKKSHIIIQAPITGIDQ